MPHSSMDSVHDLRTGGRHFDPPAQLIFFARINSFPNNKILDATKLKAYADDKLNIHKMTISLFDRVENTVGKGKNTGFQHLLLFPQCFFKAFFLVVKSQDCGKKLGIVIATGFISISPLSIVLTMVRPMW